MHKSPRSLSLTEIKAIKNFVKTNKKQLKKALKRKLVTKLCELAEKEKESKLKQIVAIIKEVTNTDDVLDDITDAFGNIKELALKVKDSLLDKLEEKNVTSNVLEMAHNLFCSKSNKTDFPSILPNSTQDADSSDENADVAIALDLVEYLDIFKLIGLEDLENEEPKDLEDLLRLEELLESEDVEDLNGLSRAFARPRPDTSENARNNLPFFLDTGKDTDKNSTPLLTFKKCKDKKSKKLKKCKNKNKITKESKGQQFFLRWDFLDEEQGWQPVAFKRANFLVKNCKKHEGIYLNC